MMEYVLALNGLAITCVLVLIGKAIVNCLSDVVKHLLSIEGFQSIPAKLVILKGSDIKF